LPILHTQSAPATRAPAPPAQVGVFTYLPTITALSGNVGSLGGGTLLTLSVGGAGLAGIANSSSAVSVSMGGLPCPLVDSPSASQVVCAAPAFPVGMALIEYWVVPMVDYGSPFASTVPDFESLGPPGGDGVGTHVVFECW
jgi:hypothetical protein